MRSGTRALGHLQALGILSFEKAVLLPVSFPAQARHVTPYLWRGCHVRAAQSQGHAAKPSGDRGLLPRAGCLELLTSVSLPAGLLTATVASRIHRAAQPALLYLVPFTLLPLLTMAYLKVRKAGISQWKR